MLDRVKLSSQWRAGEIANIRSNTLKLTRSLVSEDLAIARDMRIAIFVAVGFAWNFEGDSAWSTCESTPNRL